MSKIAVLGAGVVGSAYAALLAGGGHEVTLIARGERYHRLTKGLRVHLDAQVLDERIAVSRSLAGVEHDTLVVAVRGDQLADALGAASTSSAPAVLLFSNPLGLREAAEQALGRSRTVWCFSGVGGLIGAHGVMAHHVKQQPTVVEWGQPCSGAAVDLLSSTGLQLRREPRMSDWLNTHTLFVAALASTVLMRPMETRRDRLTSARELTDGMREGFQAWERQGHTVVPANLRAIFGKVPAPVASAYWAHQFTRPVVTVSVLPHARATRGTEQQAVARRALDLVGSGAPAYTRLVHPMCAA